MIQFWQTRIFFSSSLYFFWQLYTENFSHILFFCFRRLIIKISYRLSSFFGIVGWMRIFCWKKWWKKNKKRLFIIFFQGEIESERTRKSQRKKGRSILFAPNLSATRKIYYSKIYYKRKCIWYFLNRQKRHKVVGVLRRKEKRAQKRTRYSLEWWYNLKRKGEITQRENILKGVKNPLTFVTPSTHDKLYKYFSL